MSDEVQRSLGRIEGKMDQALEWMERHEKTDTDRFSVLDRRLGSVEKKTWAAGGIISLVVAYLTTKLSGH